MGSSRVVENGIAVIAVVNSEVVAWAGFWAGGGGEGLTPNIELMKNASRAATAIVTSRQNQKKISYSLFIYFSAGKNVTDHKIEIQLQAAGAISVMKVQLHRDCLTLWPKIGLLNNIPSFTIVGELYYTTKSTLIWITWKIMLSTSQSKTRLH